MQFYNRPSKSKIALRGSSASTATSADLLAEARAQRAARAAARARVAAALVIQRALRRARDAEAARSLAEAASPRSAAALALCGVALAPRAAAAAPLSGSALARAGAAAVLVRAACLLPHTRPDTRVHCAREAARLIASLAADPALEEALDLLRRGNVTGAIANALRTNAVSGDVLRLVVDAVLEVGDSRDWRLFAANVLVVPGAVASLHLAEGRTTRFAQRLLSALTPSARSAPINGEANLADVEDADPLAGMPDKQVAPLSANLLQVSREVWSSSDRPLLWSLVSVVAALVRRMPDAALCLRDDSDSEGEDVTSRAQSADAKMRDDTDSATEASVVSDLISCLSRVVSDKTVRALFDAAVAEGRAATARVCELFSLLTRREPQLQMAFQSSLDFWRPPANRPRMRHILAGLWSMCCVERGDPDSGKTTYLDLSDGGNAVLLVFARSYSHFLSVQNEDEMFETGRPFSVDGVREIAIVLKRALFAALYVRPTFGGGGVLRPGDSSNMAIDVSTPSYDLDAAAGAGIRSDPDLLEQVAGLLSRLYVCDSRRRFRTSDDFWIAGSGALSSPSFIQDATDAGSEALLPATGGSSSHRGIGSGQVRPSRHSYHGVTSARTGRVAAVTGAGELLRVAPFMAPFDSRARIFHQWVATERKKFAGHAVFGGINGRWITVRRNFLLQDAFDKLRGLRREIKRSLRVRFIDEHGMEEAGIDGGGVYKEFMFEVLRSAFSPSYGLFTETHDGHLYPNPSAHLVDEDFEQRFEFVGMLMGKAMFDGVLVDIPLASFFLSKLLRKFNYPSDLRSLDPELYRNLMFLRKCDDPEVVDSLGLNFVVTNSAFGQNTEVELVRGGSNMPVTYANRIEYIHRVSNYRMNSQLRKQSEAFIRGFSEVIRPEYIQLFSEAELQLLLSGSMSAPDIADLQRNTKYSGGYTEDSDVIRWFWQAVYALGPEDQAKLLQFVTSSPRAPLLGFAYLNPNFCVHRAEGDARLPTASTCLNLLKLPHYKDFETLRAKLKYSLESNSGFDLS